MKTEISDKQTIEEILAEANAYGLKWEVQDWANKLMNEGKPELEAYQLAFYEWIK